MEITINKETIDNFENYWTDPAFVEYLSVNAPDYIVAALILQSCEELTRKLRERLASMQSQNEE